MKKVIKSKIILGIIIIIAISIVGIKMATKEEMNIKGVKYENGKIVETDLGKYNKNKKYEGYEAYILSDNSDYNIFKNDKVEVKYPKILKIWYITKTDTYFSYTDEATFIKENNNEKVVKNFSMNISYSQYTDKDVNIKEIVESRKKFMDSNKKALKFSNIEYKVDGNKVFETDIGENGENGGFSEIITDEKNIYGLTILHNNKSVKNWDEIIKNIKESFKIL
ncbi:hypothetical protein UT300002_26970 [Clostridium perfringens]